MLDTVIDKIYNDYSVLLDYLEENKEISLRNDADNNFKRVLLLSIASFFEYEINDALLRFISINSRNNMIYSFTKIKGIDRQYHSYFDWPGRKANKFYSLFGDEFKKDIEKEIKSNEALRNSVNDFLEIGFIRNELVHKNFATYPLDKTAKDIYNLYKSAIQFVDYLKKRLSS
ncbi:MAG: HEPN domain-containing protein [Methanothrix sp.]